MDGKIYGCQNLWKNLWMVKLMDSKSKSVEDVGTPVRHIQAALHIRSCERMFASPLPICQNSEHISRGPQNVPRRALFLSIFANLFPATDSLIALNFSILQ